MAVVEKLQSEIDLLAFMRECCGFAGYLVQRLLCKEREGEGKLFPSLVNG